MTSNKSLRGKNLANRVQERGGRISGNDYKMEEIDTSVKENIKS